MRAWPRGTDHALGELAADGGTTVAAQWFADPARLDRGLREQLIELSHLRMAWAVEAAERGAGEILLNSIDADGTEDGFDLDMLRAVRARVSVPLITSGGAGTAAHFTQAAQAGADAVLAASVFHFGTLSIGAVKADMRAAGLPVRGA